MIAPIGTFIRERLDGTAPLGTVFWRDMMLFGTVLAVASTAAALAVFAGDAPTALGIAVFLSPLPYNALVTVGVWKAAARTTPLLRDAARIVALLWLIAATVF